MTFKKKKSTLARCVVPAIERLENRCLLSASPTVTTIQPAANATDVPRDEAVTADFFFPNGALNSNTVTVGTVLLYRTSDHAPVSSVVNTTGGNDAIILQPSVLLDADTSYTFQITSGVHDTTGAPVTPFMMSFTTGTAGATVDASIAFEQISLPTAQNVPFTCVRVGPDHQLWASSEDGLIYHYPINPDGTLGQPQVLNSLQTANNGPRVLTGFTFDPASTAANPILWVSSGVYPLPNEPDFSCKITRMSGPNLQTVQDIVVGLPRSVSDHMTDQPVFGPDGALYFCQAAENSMGGPDIVWGNRPEHLLSAAVLRLDTNAALALGHPLNVVTPDGGGTYDPTAAGAPLTIYATGLRNGFNLLWTSDGHLLAPVNGASAGGNTPAGPGVPALTQVPQVESDYLYNITQNGYYGHPDPVRNQFVLDGGNPTAGADPAEITAYPVGTQPDPNYQFPVYDFGLHRSPDGIIQYTGNAFNGALNGKIFVAEYSAGDDIVVLTPGPNGTIASAQHNIAGLTGGFQNPINLAEDPATGFIYVAELGGKRLTLLVPIAPHPAANLSTTVMAFNSVATGNPGAGPSHTMNITVTNTGTVPLSLSGYNIVADPTGASGDASTFKVTSAPASVAAGQSATISIVYRATVVGMQKALLNITTNDPAKPQLQIQLHGIGTAGQFGTLEPSLAQILLANDIPTNIGVSDINNSQYPENPDPSSQEQTMPRLVKAGAGAVTITPLASFDAASQPTMRLGFYLPGDLTDKSELFTVGQGDDQTVNPTALGATSFDPGSSPFSMYAIFPGASTPDGSLDVHYSEDAFNTLDQAHPRKFRFFPLENADGSVVANAYVVAVEDFNSPQFNSFTNFVGIIRNVVPASDATSAPVLGLTNLDGVPSTTRMIFSRIQEPNPTNPAGFVDAVHDTATLRINNSGDQALIINALTLSDSTNWQIVNPPTLPANVAPGGSLPITIQFIAQSVPAVPYNETNDTATVNGIPVTQAGGVWNGTLTITSNDPVNPSRAVQLAGYWQHTSENENEPGVQTITNLLLGYQTAIANTQRTDLPNNGTTPVLYGDEYASALWAKADPTQNILVTQIDAYHNQFDTSSGSPVATAATLYWYPQGGGQRTIFQDATGNGQTLFPATTVGGMSIGSFSPSGNFGWNLDGENSKDSLNTTDINTYSRSGHAVRFYPVRDSSGNIVPNTWLIAMDYQGGPFDNSDYQDLMFLVTNMRPAAAPPTPADLYASAGANGGVLLQWAPDSYNGSVGYDVYRASSPNGPFVKINPATSSQTSFLDMNAAVGTTMYYRVVAVDLGSNAQSEPASAHAAATSAAVGTTSLPAPTNLIATANADGTISLTWTPSPGAASYHVERLAPTDTVFTEIATGITGNSYMDSGLTPGTLYQYRVRAENASGLSAYSLVASATTAGTVSVGGGGGGGGLPFTVTQDLGSITKGSRRVRGTLSPADTADYYSFTLTAQSKVTLRLSGLKFNADLELLDSTGAVIAGSHHPRKRAESITLKLNAGTYYIKSYLIDTATTRFLAQLGVTPVHVKKVHTHHKHRLLRLLGRRDSGAET